MLTMSVASARQVQVKGYTKKDGTVVQSHTREVKDKVPDDKQEVKGYTRKDGTVVKVFVYDLIRPRSIQSKVFHEGNVFPRL